MEGNNAPRNNFADEELDVEINELLQDIDLNVRPASPQIDANNAAGHQKNGGRQNDEGQNNGVGHQGGPQGGPNNVVEPRNNDGPRQGGPNNVVRPRNNGRPRQAGPNNVAGQLNNGGSGQNDRNDGVGRQGGIGNNSGNTTNRGRRGVRAGKAVKQRYQSKMMARFLWDLARESQFVQQRPQQNQNQNE